MSKKAASRPTATRLTAHELTPLINQQNVESVRNMIDQKKNYCRPYYANSKTVTNVITDQDHFPYTRYFRGVSYYPEPVVFEREAGWREVKNPCYKTVGCESLPSPYPNHCFEQSCSGTYPCFPSYQKRYSDKAALDVQLNNACIVEYR